MSTANASDQSRGPFNPNLGLRFILADQLIPFFQTGATGLPLARRMALGALEAYAPESRADYVNSARTVAFSIAALALLGHAAPESVTMTEKMRAYGRANALNRSADQSERTMMQRRRYQNTHPRAEQPDYPTPEPPADDPVMDDMEVEAAVAEVLATRCPPPLAQTEETRKPVMSKAQTLLPMVSPTFIPSPFAATAILASAKADSDQVGLKQRLMRRVTMPHAATQTAVQRPKDYRPGIISQSQEFSRVQQLSHID